MMKIANVVLIKAASYNLMQTENSSLKLENARLKQQIEDNKRNFDKYHKPYTYLACFYYKIEDQWNRLKEVMDELSKNE